MRFAHLPVQLAILLSVLGLVGCTAIIGEGPPEPAEPDAGEAPEPIVDAGPPVQDSDAGEKVLDSGESAAIPACARATQQAQGVLLGRCAGCHGPDSLARGGFDTVLDVPSLIDSGKVVPKKPEDSPLYEKLAAGTMPPATEARPTPAEVKAVGDWITCGAPAWNDISIALYAFISIDTRLDMVLDDLRSMPNPADRVRMRYIDLTALANAGYSREQLQLYRETVTFLLNSLSRGRTPVAPEPIDPEALMYRLDLRDYVWSEDTWRSLEELYPYAAVYDQDSRLFPVDETSAERIREETGTQIPIIQADWFISHASRPPLYHELLNLPTTVNGLEAELGVDIDGNIASEDVLRAGFKTSEVSRNNRVIERHEFNGNGGALWRSYDFANTVGDRNIFANPLDFDDDGGSFLFSLDNGLQGYFLANGAGNRIDKAPNNVLRDPLSRDGAVENGLSCMGCHQLDGVLAKLDEIRDFTRSNASPAIFEQVAGLYAESAVLSDAFEDDQARYRDTLAALGIENLTATTLHELDDTHLGVMNIDTVASVIGIKGTELERALDASPQAFPAAFLTLRAYGGGVQRDLLEDVIGEVLEGLALGTQLRVGPANVDDDEAP